MFGKKKDGNTAAPQLQPGLPLEAVVAMRQQGLSNNQIIQTLQREGYNQTQVFDAINQADIKGGVEKMPPDQFSNPAPGNPMIFSPQPASQGYGQAGGMEQPYTSAGSTDVERIEELAEAIIDEKWNELVKNINKIIEWKNKTEAKIAQLEQQMKDMRAEFDALHKGVLGRIGEYDQNITNIGAELKAMEKVFSKVLPTFTENVNELTRVTNAIKGAVTAPPPKK
ncbi:hypothetical protein JXB02_02695 [Candidatus Woesearchaeota archaeon]|nr:hypothetical protein [Candidatus Woesearchaeota archaeon]